MGHHSMKGKSFPKREKKILAPEEYQITGRMEQILIKLRKEYERCLSEETPDDENYYTRMAHFVILGICSYATQEPYSLVEEIMSVVGELENNIFTQYLRTEGGKPTENARVAIGSYAILLLAEFGYEVTDLVELCYNRGWKKKVKAPEFTNRIAIAIRKIFQRKGLEETLVPKIIEIQPLPIKKKWEIEREKKIKAMEEKRANGWKKLPTPVVPKKVHPSVGYWSDRSIEMAKAALVLGYEVIGKEAIPQYHGKSTMVRAYMRKLGLHAVIGENAFPEMQPGEEILAQEIIDSRKDD